MPAKRKSSGKRKPKRQQHGKGISLGDIASFVKDHKVISYWRYSRAKAQRGRRIDAAQRLVLSAVSEAIVTSSLTESILKAAKADAEYVSGVLGIIPHPGAQAAAAVARQVGLGRRRKQRGAGIFSDLGGGLGSVFGGIGSGVGSIAHGLFGGGRNMHVQHLSL